MSKKEALAKLAESIMQKQANIRNIGVVAHIDHGKTTLTDNFVSEAGLISSDLAGKQCFTDSYHMEQERGITINAANVSIVHKHKGEQILINIIDTPGHIDFGGDVIRAMRAVDGVIVVVDAVEGVMPQTETVIRQALREQVKPILFVNKVDRLLNELQVTEEEMQKRFMKVIAQVNDLIKKNAPEQYQEKWLVKVQDGSVTFGSGYHNWGVNMYSIEETKIGFKEIYQYMKEDRQKELGKATPVSKCLLRSVVEHIPNPVQSQGYRMEKIWGGDPESVDGKAMKGCDFNGPFSMMVIKVVSDQHAGDIALGRIYSGTVKKGMKVHLVGSQKEATVQQVGIYMGPERTITPTVSAGNIGAIVGLKDAFAGETVAENPIQEFETFASNTQPVMTVSIEAKNTKDLPKLIEAIKSITKEDPNIKATINQETGEHLLAGSGELHLEVRTKAVEDDYKIPITVSPPIIVYQESLAKESEVIEGKSPNKHNKFKIKVEPVSEEMKQKLIEAKIPEKIKPKDDTVIQKLMDCGFEKDKAKVVWAVRGDNVLVNGTKGIQNLNETKELIIEAFTNAVTDGPLAKEKMSGMMVTLVDATLHEDAVHRGPAQTFPAISRPIYACLLSSDPYLLEPMQNLAITVPESFMGSVSKELSQRRTQISEMRTEGDQMIILAKAPVKELLGFSQAMRSATQGRALWTAEYAGYSRVPRELQGEVVRQIRQRKGLSPEPKDASEFMD